MSWAAKRTRLYRSGAVPSRPSMMARRRSRVRSGADTLFIGMLPGAPATTEGPFSCLTSGRVHPNPNFQQSQVFTPVHIRKALDLLVWHRAAHLIRVAAFIAPSLPQQA